jgi:two-component system, NtrC family, response regulator AlgB
VGVEHLPDSISPTARPLQIGDAVTLRQLEEEHIRRVLASAPSLQEAADLLGIDQATLWRKRKQYEI